VRHFDLDFVQLFGKIATDCDLDPYTTRYCINRLRAEGIKFWTVTLPKLAKFVLHSIECGRITDRPTDFAWQGCSLRYFRSLLHKIFCRKTGVLLEEPDASSLANIRQISEYVYKLSLDFSDDQLKEAENKYEANQRRLATFPIQSSKIEKLRRFAETHYKALYSASPDFVLSHGTRFGPGSFASILGGLHVPFYEWKQMGDSDIGTTIKAFSSYSGYFKPYPSSPTPIRIVSTYAQAEVLFVPKDSRGPRVISKEPPHLLKAQMAFFNWMSSTLCNSSKGRINFGDQTINQRLACESSVTRENATLDMKDASDSILEKLVRGVGRHSPAFRWFLKNARSTTYKLPSGKVGIQYALAGMGSGLTFPVLAFIIHLVVCESVCSTLRLPFKAVSSRVYVYGDDLIIPVEWVSIATKALTECALNINTTKSYVKGPFRESCGADYLQGKDVAPIRLRLQNAGISLTRVQRTTYMSSRNADWSNLVLSLVRHTHVLRKGTLNNTAKYIEDLLERVIPMPYVGEGSPALGRFCEDPSLIIKQGNHDDNYSSTVIRACTSVPVIHIAKRSCPYKFLAPKIKPSLYDDKLEQVIKDHLPQFVKPSYQLEMTSSAAAFGEISVPRRTKLKSRKYPSTSLLPVVSSSYTS